MEAHPFLPEGIEVLDSSETDGPTLKLVGGTALEQSVEVTPVLASMADEAFKAHVDASAANGGLEALLHIDHMLNAETASITVQISELTQQLHSLYEKKRWNSGYIGDRR